MLVYGIVCQCMVVYGIVCQCMVVYGIPKILLQREEKKLNRYNTNIGINKRIKRESKRIKVNQRESKIIKENQRESNRLKKNKSQNVNFYSSSV